MTPQELRIGNYVERNGVITTIQSINPQQKHQRYDLVNPIPLTDEWLLKFGFENRGNRIINEFEHELQFVMHNFIDGTSDFKVCFNTSTYGGTNHQCIEIRIDYDSIYVNETKYVHQLQNLYFALTGQELTIKL